MRAIIYFILLNLGKVNVPQYPSEFRITDVGDRRITDDGSTRITDGS